MCLSQELRHRIHERETQQTLRINSPLTLRQRWRGERDIFPIFLRDSTTRAVSLMTDWNTRPPGVWKTRHTFASMDLSCDACPHAGANTHTSLPARDDRLRGRGLLGGGDRSNGAAVCYLYWFCLQSASLLSSPRVSCCCIQPPCLAGLIRSCDRLCVCLCQQTRDASSALEATNSRERLVCLSITRAKDDGFN